MSLIQQIRFRREIFKAKRKRRIGRLPRQRHPDLIAASYFGRIREFLRQARARVHREILPTLPALVSAAARARGDTRTDAINDEMDALERAYFEEFDNSYEAAGTARTIADRTQQYQGSELQAQLRAALGVELPLNDRGMRARIEAFTQENVALIKTVPSRYFGDVEKRITAGVADGLRWEEIAVELEERYQVAEDTAKLIARDQVGKFYGDLNEARQTELGVESYVWRTSNDNRVRPEHAEREGKSFVWSEEPEDGHPGEAVNCRCYAEPDLTALLEEL